MDDVVEVTIPVEAQAAAALADAGTREMVGRLVGRVLERRRRKVARLLDVMDRFAAEARTAGLTAEIVAEEWAAYNAERRDVGGCVMRLAPAGCRTPPPDSNWTRT